MKLTIGKKLGLAFGTLLALMVISSALAYSKAQEIRGIQALVDLRGNSVSALYKLQGDLNQTQSKGRQAVLAGTEQSRKDVAQKAFESAWNDIAKGRCHDRSSCTRLDCAGKSRSLVPREGDLAKAPGSSRGCDEPRGWDKRGQRGPWRKRVHRQSYERERPLENLTRGHGRYDRWSCSKEQPRAGVG